MKTIKLKLHSAVDLITNSSTVIFTYSDGSLSAIKNLVNEILRTFDKTETFDDIFYANVFLEDDYQYRHNSRTDINNEMIEQTINDVLTDKIEKPDWMIKAEDATNYEGYRYPTELYLKPKDEKYKALSNELLKYLYSTDHEAYRDG